MRCRGRGRRQRDRRKAQDHGDLSTDDLARRALYCQYQMFISPDTVSGIRIPADGFRPSSAALRVVGPTVGAVITILLAEVLRIGWHQAAAGTTSSMRAAGWCSLSSCPRASWQLAERLKTATQSLARAFSGEVESVRVKKARQIKNLEPRFDSIETGL